MGAAVTPWHGSIMDRVSLDDMPHKGNIIDYRPKTTNRTERSFANKTFG